MSRDWAYQHFSPEEFRCRCGCGRVEMHHDFMERLVKLRIAMDVPFVVTSGYRCPDYNNAVSSTGYEGPHVSGRAVDIRMSGADARLLLWRAVDHQFTGIGVKQHGPHGTRFVHLDDLQNADGRPRPWAWSYP